MSQKNVIFMVNMPERAKPGRNTPYELSVKSWKTYADRFGNDLMVLQTRVYPENIMNANWHKMFALDLLDNEGVDYDKVLIVDGDTIIHPDAPDIFEQFGDDFYAAHNAGSYDWLLRSMEIYSNELFSGAMFDFTEYVNTGVMMVNRSHKEFFNTLKEFYLENRPRIQNIQNTYHVGTDQPVINFLLHTSDEANLSLLPYEWNMQDMVRREILNLDLLFTEYGYVYHFNAIPQNYRVWSNDIRPPVQQWMEYTYEKLYG